MPESFDAESWFTSIYILENLDQDRLVTLGDEQLTIAQFRQRVIELGKDSTPMPRSYMLLIDQLELGLDYQPPSTLYWEDVPSTHAPWQPAPTTPVQPVPSTTAADLSPVQPVSPTAASSLPVTSNPPILIPQTPPPSVPEFENPIPSPPSQGIAGQSGPDSSPLSSIPSSPNRSVGTSARVAQRQLAPPVAEPDEDFVDEDVDLDMGDDESDYVAEQDEDYEEKGKKRATKVSRKTRQKGKQKEENSKGATGNLEVDLGDVGHPRDLSYASDVADLFQVAGKESKGNRFYVLDARTYPCNGGYNVCRWEDCRLSFKTLEDLKRHLASEDAHCVVFKRAPDNSKQKKAPLRQNPKSLDNKLSKRKADRKSNGRKLERGALKAESGEAGPSRQQPEVTAAIGADPDSNSGEHIQSPPTSCRWFNGKCPNRKETTPGSCGRHILDHRFFYFCPDPQCATAMAYREFAGTHGRNCQNRHFLLLSYDIASEKDLTILTQNPGKFNNDLREKLAKEAAREFHEAFAEEIRRAFSNAGVHGYRF
ncbi:hypothetical protein CVT24_010260 [Panaeolus cyanescens]|uniref:Uncharacterized protein n=1 Tax=Panaeolus cyanescens TaxID=181874 RepID=A0A409YPY6_9AGAR|nr:hypothetical protein CVT24_010260 [Panaeolus cyanescens]